jgi:hypothetical protein
VLLAEYRYADFCYAECLSAECFFYAECRYAERRFSECRYGWCRGAVTNTVAYYFVKISTDVNKFVEHAQNELL